MNVLTSISFSSDNYRISVGSKLQLATIQEPESASCTLSFASDNKSVATVDGDGLVTALSEGVAHITVTADENLTATCTVTVTPLKEVPNIASFCAINEGDEALLTLTNAQVLYVYAGDIYLRDATGSLVLSGTGLDVSKKDVLNGNILGCLTYSNSMPQLTAAESVSAAENLTITSGDEPMPIEIYGEELTAKCYADMVLVRGLTLVRDGGVFAVIGDHRVRLWNKFQIKSPKITLPSSIDNKYFDVTAIYGTDIVNGEVIDELYLLSSPVEGEDPDAINLPLGQAPSPSVLYNLQGQRVGKNYKGIIVKSGKKYLQK